MIEEEIKQIGKEIAYWLKKIGTKKSFGDPKLIALVKKIDSRMELLNKTDPCEKCNGTGGKLHHCTCEWCETEFENCVKCDNTGRVPKKEL